MKRRFLASVVSASMITVAAADPAELAHWSFDQGPPTSGGSDPAAMQSLGPVMPVAGVRGSAIKLDGFRSYLRQDSFRGGALAEGFSVEGWVALGSYPWAWAPVVDTSRPPLQGFFFGIGPEGQLGLKWASGNLWHELVSEPTIELRRWTHVAVVAVPDTGVRLYLDGECVARAAMPGRLIPARPGRPLTLGRTAEAGTWREHQLTTEEVHFFLDGLLDEVRVLAGALDPAAIRQAAQRPAELEAPALSRRDVLPKGPVGDGRFGAFSTRLDYYPEWDALWRVGDRPDVFVRFDRSPVQFVFWRGTSYVPCWVTENDIWYTNEWLETWGADVVSCAEPIMDRDCRFSRVRILENTPARVVIHWRYALNDAFYQVAAIGDDGRGEWAEETHILYPDQVGVRKMELYDREPRRKHDWVEQIVVLPPGKHPDQVIHRDAVSLVNQAGETQTYTWSDSMSMEMTEPAGAHISHVRLKSRYRPFLILPPGPVETVEGSWDAPFFRSYAACMARPGYRPDPVPSVFGWWDHWPVAQVPGDGRWVTRADRPSHFNLTTFVQWQDHETTPRKRTRIMLQGVTDGESAELVPLAKSWTQPPPLRCHSDGFRSDGYDPAQRAYVVSRIDPAAAAMELSLAASEDSPLVHAALVIRGWGQQGARVEVDGEVCPGGPSLRQGHVAGIDGTDLVLWLERRSTKPLDLRISARPVTHD